MNSPLEGIKVVEVGDDLAAEMCGKLLRALGAEVTKIEPATGFPSRNCPPLDRRGQSALFAFLNEGKVLVAAHAVGENPLGGNDIVVIGGEHIESGCDLQALADGGAVVARVTAWGEHGGSAGLPSSEVVLQAAAGLMNLVGDPDRAPLALGGHQAAYSTGMQLFTGIMLALRHRDQTGDGQIVATSYLETLAYLEWKGGVYYQTDGTLLERGASTGPLVLEAADGHVAFYYRDTDWDSVRALFDDPRLDAPKFQTQRGRIEAEGALSAVLTEHTRTWRKDELYHAAQRRGIPVGSVKTLSDLLASEQYRAQRFFETVDDGADAGPIVQPSLPFTFNDTRFPLRSAGENLTAEEGAGLEIAMTRSTT